MKTLGPEDFRKATNVSRETLARLELYAALLEKWSGAINLVSRDSLPELWRRHMLDSAQLLALLPPPPRGRPRTILDLGSGAGFPGLVLAILGAGDVHLVEADTKKIAFLREAAHITQTEVKLHNCRIEDLAPIPVDVLTARALAPLPRLLDLVEPFFQQAESVDPNEQANTKANKLPNPAQGVPRPEGPMALFPKGRDAERELTDSAEKWMMRVEVFPSRSDPNGQIVRLSGLARKGHRP